MFTNLDPFRNDCTYFNTQAFIGQNDARDVYW